MQKKKITARIQQAVGIPGEQAATLLDGILDLFKATLQAGEPISIQNFGKFTVRSKRPRQGRNPQTGEAVMISARRVVTFQPSLVLKAEVNLARQQDRCKKEGE
jgi:integration host factor subunit alpha